MSRVVGIDFSLTGTGIGILTAYSGPVRADCTLVKSSGKRADTLPDRRARLRELAANVTHIAARSDLAVVELPTSFTKGGSELDRHACWWWIVDELMACEVPVATVPATALKLALAGKGNADKAAVAVAVERLWPGLDIATSDVSDAVGLAHLGAVHLGWDVKTLDRYAAVKAAWPELPDPTAKGAA